MRGSQLEGAYKKRKGTLLSQSEHSITFLPAGKTKATILSNRDEGRYHADDQPCSSKQADEQLAEQQFFAIRNELPIGNKLPEKHKLPEENELPEENKLPEGNELTEKTNYQYELIGHCAATSHTARQKSRTINSRQNNQ